MKRFLLYLLSMMLAENTFSQVQEHAKWKYEVEKINCNKLQLVLTATIDPGWHIYSSNMEDGGPQKTEVTTEPGKVFPHHLSYLLMEH